MSAAIARGSRCLRSGLQKAQHRCRGFEFGETEGAAFERERITAPLLHIPVLVDVRRLPGFLDRQASPRQGESNERRAGERRRHAERPEAPGVAGNGGAGAGERVFILGNVNDTHFRAQRCAKHVACPGKDGVPMLRLPCDEPRRRTGAIANKIGAKIVFDLRRYRVWSIADAVDDRIGET